MLKPVEATIERMFEMDIRLTNDTIFLDVSTSGAEMQSLRDGKGREYLWDGSDFWKRHAPYLFPIVGGLRYGETMVGGQVYKMGQHGFARDMEWTCVQADETAATLMLVSDDSTLARYPYPFKLKARYELTGYAVNITIAVENTGETEMPFCFGTHPSFRCPFAGSGSQFTDYEVQFDKDEIPTQPVLNADKLLDRVNRQAFMADPKTIKLDYAVFEKVDTIIFDEIHSDKVRLVDTGTGKYLELRYQGFHQMGIWTPKAGAPFVCIEPWNGTADTADTDGLYLRKVGLRLLAPGAEESYTLTIDVSGCQE